MELENNEKEIRIAMSSIEENTRKLYEVTEKGCIESLKILMEEDPYIIQTVVSTSSSNNNETHLPLLHLSISSGHLEFTRLLIHYKPQLAAEVDSLQRTPLHLASKLGKMEIVEALLEKNMSACFVYDSDGMIPLHYAVLSGQTDVIQKLVKVRPRSLWMKLKNNGQTVLHLCVESNHLEVMKFLIETYVNDDEDFLNSIDDHGNTILDLSMLLRQRKVK
ncbi:inversin-A-like isoform X2 [Cucumis melo var. makuwa]|uniref:Inversin-A-like isoform X2 n=1 Tax=Cucumis melo var. makuwa TaxID=1194695 RepID=A0A5A7UTH2_CUCMM|nr:inversin-A-like isoform X2 [Cucumis melo var. makuwa]TYK07288.1 inversin-A-like isoform X2 [Cucumis melo var. makuwa]